MEAEATLASDPPTSRTGGFFPPKTPLAVWAGLELPFLTLCPGCCQNSPMSQVLFLAAFIVPQKSPKEAQTKAGSWEPRRLTPDVVALAPGGWALDPARAQATFQGDSAVSQRG